MMQKLLLLFSFLLLMNSCSKKGYLDRGDEDKALQDAVRKITKSPSDENAADAIPVLYKNIRKNRLAKIASLETASDRASLEKIVGEYEALQTAYESILNSPPAFRLITPDSYSAQLITAKEKAAEAYYNYGAEEFAKKSRNNLKNAYTAFSRANELVPGFKDAEQRMNETYELALVNVIVYPVQDNTTFGGGGGWTNPANNSSENMQRNLVRDMSVRNEKKYPARFYTDREAYRENIRPDWIVDLVLRRLDIPYPEANSYSRNVSREISNGTDTAGRPVYTRVNATLYVTRNRFTARANMDVTVKDVVNNKNVKSTSFNEEYKWEQEVATYTGDSRALSSADWNLVNNRNNQPPSRDFVMNELYQKLYPRVRNYIGNTIRW